MARFVTGLVAGIVIATVAGAAVGLHAQADDVAAAAAAAGVDERDLRGALNSQAMHGLTADPWTYLRSNRELPSEKTLPPSASNSPAAPTSGVFSSRVECIIAKESGGEPNARNRSGASGLGQFLPSTWVTTPQGRAGMSVWDPAANTAAIGWMLSVGRAKEFDAVRYFGC
jgi:soluble lytic murein transglycosylase-like protein